MRDLRPTSQAAILGPRCWPWKHEWGEWEVIDRGRVMYRKGGGTAGYFIVQQRRCAACGKTQIELQSTP